MVEDTYLFDWAEELVDKIAVSICDVISNEGGNDPVAIVEREYGKLSPEKQFLLEYQAASGWEEERKEVCVALAKQNIVEVWDALNFVP
jgi:hypothetical protein